MIDSNNIEVMRENIRELAQRGTIGQEEIDEIYEDINTLSGEIVDLTSEVDENRTNISAINSTLHQNWVDVPLQEGWQNLSAEYGNLSVKKSGDIVALKGIVKKTGTSTLIGTLPANYRPQHRLYFMCNSAGTALTVTLAPSGEIRQEGTVGAWLSMANVVFAI